MMQGIVLMGSLGGAPPVDKVSMRTYAKALSGVEEPR